MPQSKHRKPKEVKELQNLHAPSNTFAAHIQVLTHKSVPGLHVIDNNEPPEYGFKSIFVPLDMAQSKAALASLGLSWP